MNSTLKWLLISAAAAYFLFRDQLAGTLSEFEPHPAAPPASPAQPPAAAAPLTPQSASTTRALIQQAAKSDANYIANSGRMTPFMWNFYYTAVRGTAAPSPDDIGLNGSMLVSLDEYWTAATAHGLSGLRAVRAGVVAGTRRRSLAARAWVM